MVLDGNTLKMQTARAWGWEANMIPATDTVPTIALVVSAIALFISGITAWLTLLKRGVVLMTRPTTIYFGPDGRGGGDEELQPQKVYLRTLLYATSKRGRIIEGMHLRLKRRETVQNFNVWIYGDEKMHRGSGLFVPESGFSSNHHFLLPKDGPDFKFLAGEYQIDVYASVVGEQGPRHLNSIALTVTAEQAEALKSSDQGLYFDWEPEIGKYHSHLRPRPKADLPPFIRELLG